MQQQQFMQQQQQQQQFQHQPHPLPDASQQQQLQTRSDESHQVELQSHALAPDQSQSQSQAYGPDWPDWDAPEWAWLGASRAHPPSAAATERGVSQLSVEVRALEEVRAFYHSDHAALLAGRGLQLRARTLRGRLTNSLGYLLSLFCLYKILTSAANVLLRRAARTDPASRAIQLFLEYVLDLDIDVRTWSQHLSFVMVGALVATQMRGFLLFIAKVFRAWAAFMTVDAVLLLLTEVMGTYFLSMVLLLRVNLPTQYRRVITKVLGKIQFSFYHRWFDAIFVVSALLTIVTFVVSRRAARSRLVDTGFAPRRSTAAHAGRGASASARDNGARRGRKRGGASSGTSKSTVPGAIAGDGGGERTTGAGSPLLAASRDADSRLRRSKV